MLETHRLRLLKEFAERGTIVAAAAALGYTPSAVSQQLATLEREAGVALLDRTARTAELTDSGRRLAAHAERILALVEEAEADLAGREPSGRVAVTAFATAAIAFAPALARAVRAHSGLTLLLRQAAPGRGPAAGPHRRGGHRADRRLVRPGAWYRPGRTAVPAPD